MSPAARAENGDRAARAKLRATLLRVLIVQLVSVLLLGLIQLVYNR